MKKEFVAPEPAMILRHSKNGITVVTRLYGEVSQDRIAKETKELHNRVDQLQPYVPSRKIEFYDIPRVREEFDDMDDAKRHRRRRADRRQYGD